MSLIALGVSHRTAPVPMLERLALPADAQTKLLHELSEHASVGEAMVVATCNRVEVYVEADMFHPALDAATEGLSRATGVSADELVPHLYVHYEDRAVQHLFTMASGLDSMVVGEAQILGQVRQSMRMAQDEGTLGRGLNDLVQTALRVGKRAHSETGIDQAGDILGPLEVAAHPVEPVCGASEHHQSSSTQVSLVPPPWLELTTSEPASSATRVSPPGTMRTSLPVST